MTGEEWLKQKIREGALVSGKPLPADFKQGWGHQITFRSHGMTAHYWTKETGAKVEAEMVALYGKQAEGAAMLVSACGLRRLTTARVPVMGPGNLPFCTRCENKLMKELK